MKPKLMGFPNRYENLELPTSGPWYDAASRAYKLLKAGGIVALYGGRGTGKTFMAYDIAGQSHTFPGAIIPEKLGPPPTSAIMRPAIYRTAMRIFLEIRGTYQRGAERTELEIMDEFAEAALLVIDEAQERGESEFENQKLTSIIDSRYAHGRPTILIGNYATKAEFAASISPSIVSRIQEGGGAIHCAWPSFRANPPKNDKSLLP